MGMARIRKVKQSLEMVPPKEYGERLVAGELIQTIKTDLPMPKGWDYDKSVKKCQNLYKEVREKGAKILIELRIAHKLLTEDSKKKQGRKWPNKTFDGYCEEIGITKKTAYNWFHKYMPKYLPKSKWGKVKNYTIPKGELSEEEKRKEEEEEAKKIREEYKKHDMAQTIREVRNNGDKLRQGLIALIGFIKEGEELKFDGVNPVDFARILAGTYRTLHDFSRIDMKKNEGFQDALKSQLEIVIEP